MARVESRVLVLCVAAAALILVGCHDNEKMGNISTVLGVVAGALGVFQRVFATTQGFSTRIKTGILVFFTGLFAGVAVCFYLFVDENFQFETAFQRAGERLAGLFESHDHEHPGAPAAAQTEGKAESAHNWLIARASCPKCGIQSELCTAFKFGECAHRVYRLNDEIRWSGGKADEGTRTDSRVWVRAFAESCPNPNCGEEFLEFAARIERNRITALQEVPDPEVWRGRNWMIGEQLR